MSHFRPHLKAMHGYVPGEQPQGGKFIKLNTNENPYPPSAAAVRAITSAAEQGLSKYPDPVATAFRRRAAEVLDVTPEMILCGNGSDDLLTILTRAFVGEGQTIRYPYPSYVLYRTLAEIQDARCHEVAFAPDWSLSDAFCAPADGLRLAFLANPNSPSGTVLPPERVAEIADQLPCPLVVDEAYVDFAETNCLSLVKENDKVIVARTLSKSYSLAGLRFGFAIAQPQIIEQLAKVKDSYNCDALAIAGATAAIDDQAWHAENRATILATRARLTAGLDALGFETVPSQANFVWTQHPEKPARQLFEDLRQQRILVRYMDYSGWGDGLRITVGTDSEIDALLTILQTMI